MPAKKIVLDTNCLIASLSRGGQYYPVWKGLQTGKYVLCVSTDILEEYAEIMTQKMSVEVATHVIHLLLESKYVELVNPYFSLHLIEADHDDDKFVDCAFAANATYIVSDDKHYSILKEAVGFYFGGEMEERAAGYLTSEVKWEKTIYRTPNNIIYSCFEPLC